MSRKVILIAGGGDGDMEMDIDLKMKESDGEGRVSGPSEATLPSHHAAFHSKNFIRKKVKEN